MDIEEARRRLAEHPPKGDPTAEPGETLAEKAARFYREPTVPAQHQPRRGDAVEAWLKAWRDGHYDRHGESDEFWHEFNDLLDTYRLHADTGTPLGEHACEQHCDCDEATGISAGDVEVPRYPVTDEEIMALPILDMGAFHRAQDDGGPDA